MLIQQIHNSILLAEREDMNNNIDNLYDIHDKYLRISSIIALIQLAVAEGSHAINAAELGLALYEVLNQLDLNNELMAAALSKIK